MFHSHLRLKFTDTSLLDVVGILAVLEERASCVSCIVTIIKVDYATAGRVVKLFNILEIKIELQRID